MTDLQALSAIVASIQTNIANHECLGRAVAAEWKSFGRRVRDQRELRGVSIRKMALAVGISKTDLDYQERGVRPWTVAEAKRAIRYFETVKVPAEAIEAP